MTESEIKLIETLNNRLDLFGEILKNQFRLTDSLINDLQKRVDRLETREKELAEASAKEANTGGG